jgi:uncharacterized protein DUF2510
MSDQPESPARGAGWYQDPEREHTLRYWDGDGWTDDRAPDVPVARQGSDGEGKPMMEGGNAVAVLLAGLGAVIAVVGVFLPIADTESSLHIAKNSLIQHWEGPVVICIAIAGLVAALFPRTRLLALLAGGSLVGVAVIAGTDLPIEYRNEFSRALAGDASPGAGVWTVGAGGALLALSGLFVDWGALGAGSDRSGAPGPRMSRWEEIMSGQEATYDEPAEGAEEATGEASASAPSRGSRKRRFEEIMSGREIPDPEAEQPGTEDSVR